MSLLYERPLTISQAAKAAPGCPCLTTVWRWALKGVRDVKLESFVRGGRRFTTVEALERFIERTTAVADGNAATAFTSRSRQREIEEAEAKCDAAGI